MVERLWVPQPPIATEAQAPVKSLSATAARFAPPSQPSPQFLVQRRRTFQPLPALLSMDLGAQWS